MLSKGIRIFSLLLIAMGFVAAGFKSTIEATVDKAEEQKAFQLLNKVRMNPKAYNKDWNIDLSSIKAKPALKWNDTLAKVAEAKAMDMAKRNYFSHVDPDGYGINYFIAKAGYSLDKDWLKSKNANFFESISAGDTDGEDVIKNLIIDNSTPGLGHRIHLLGMNDFDSNLTDIGIGFVRCNDGCTYQTYISVIIAKHHW